MNRGIRRKNDYNKAIRKQNIARFVYGFQWYDNLHEYSKGKIHCSCPLCAAKTNPKRKRIGHGYTIKDTKRVNEMSYEEAYMCEEEF